MNPVADGEGVKWSHWGREAFTRARDERKPILLSIVASWSAGCREMDRVSYADAATAALINLRAIPIRVDADERPDVADRYDLGGLPTTAFLDADGRLLGGGTFVPPERLRTALERVTQVGRPSPEWSPASAGSPTTDSELFDLVFTSFDEVNGGFGDAPKFPLVPPVRLAIDLYAEWHDDHLREIATRTLDAMGWGPLYDEENGGFFRCAERTDWTNPQREKLLSINTGMLDLYVRAGAVLGEERFLARAADLVRYIEGRLSVAGGAWRASDGGHGAHQFSDANAQAASAMLQAAGVFEDDRLGQRALDGFERVLLSSYKPGDGVGHHAGGARGLLGDQAAMAAASLDAWEATGRMPYRMMAEELMHYAMRTMWDDGGGFRDRAADEHEPVVPGVRPFLLNCDAAVVLQRLAVATGDHVFAERAATTLEAVAPRAAEFGPLAASYLLARRETQNSELRTQNRLP
jgi:uncharacterized protein YyaL (SSP411 family)